MNSSLHSYLILAYAGSEKAAEDVGFYYAANAAGRLFGILLSGALYQFGGITACLIGSAAMLVASWLITFLLPVSQAMRAVVAADFCNGTAAVLDFREWTFVNADLTVNFARQPVGAWILLDAESWMGPDGAGLATARLADEHGYFGRAIQSLVIDKR